MANVAIPPGYALPFATTTDSDRTAWLLIATSLGMIYSVIFAAIRGFICYTTGRGFGLDDGVLALATAIAVAQSSLILEACAKGLGKTVGDIAAGSVDTVLQRMYSSNLLFIVALGLSKISVETLVLQLIPAKAQRRAHHIGIVLIAAWTVASLLALAFQCEFSHPWRPVGQACPNVLLRWQIISAFDILFEIGIVCGIVKLVWNLQTPLSNKVTVIATFAFRLAIVAFVVLRLTSFDVEGLTTDPTLAEVRFLVWIEVELHWSLISATIPCLRPMIVKLATHYGSLGPGESAIGYGSGRGSEGMLDSRLGTTDPRHSRRSTAASAPSRKQSVAVVNEEKIPDLPD